MKILKKENIYKGFLELNTLLIELPNGAKILREVIGKKDTVSIIAINENNEIYLTKQPRAGSNKLESIELPAGLIEQGESPEEAARRELEEETGCIADEITVIQKFVSDPACCDNCSYICLAKNPKQIKELSLDEDEFLECFKMPLEKAYELIDSGEINDCVSLISLLKLKNLK